MTSNLDKYGIFGACLIALSLFVWKGLWPFLKEQIESSRRILEKHSEEASERAERQTISAEQRVERQTISAEARIAKQTDDFLAALQRAQELSKLQFEQTSKILRGKSK